MEGHIIIAVGVVIEIEREIKMKITKEYRIEMEAMSKALKIAKEKGVDALEEELKMRGATKCP